MILKKYSLKNNKTVVISKNILLISLTEQNSPNSKKFVEIHKAQTLDNFKGFQGKCKTKELN